MAMCRFRSVVVFYVTAYRIARVAQRSVKFVCCQTVAGKNWKCGGLVNHVSGPNVATRISPELLQTGCIKRGLLGLWAKVEMSPLTLMRGPGRVCRAGWGG